MNTAARMNALREKLPEIERTLAAIDFLQSRTVRSTRTAVCRQRRRAGHAELTSGRAIAPA